MEEGRKEFIEEVIVGEKSKSEICRKYGISRVTGDKWIKRYEQGEELRDRSHAPFHMPSKTPVEVEDMVLEARRKHPAWGPRKLKKILEREKEGKVPATSTIADILRRNDCISEKASKASTPYKRFQKESSNEMWQADFKGHFAMKDGKRCHPLTVLDDYSRYSLCVEAKENERREGVEKSFTRLFYEYGLPEALLCDNGNPWGVSQSTGYTLFEIWLMERGILPIHGRICHPQTQGKEERFHKTMKDELLSFTEIENMAHAQESFDTFRNSYNNQRPHEALNMGTPVEYYRTSDRKMPAKIREWGYPSGFVLRRVKATGYLTYGNQGYFLSEAFGGQTIAIRESSLANGINLYYRSFRIARINIKERAYISKKIYRADYGTVGGEI